GDTGVDGRRVPGVAAELDGTHRQIRHALGNGDAAVPGRVVRHHDRVEVDAVTGQRAQAVAEHVRAVEGDDDDRDPGRIISPLVAVVGRSHRTHPRIRLTV